MARPRDPRPHTGILRPRHPRALLALTLAAGCGGGLRGGGVHAEAASGDSTQMRADAYVRRAIRSSSEGFILFPSHRAEKIYELPRLNQIAQDMRPEAAACFLNRTIETMRPVRTEEGLTYHDVPEGQAKIRVRIAPSGEVMRTEVLETGFSDETMVPCIQQVIERQRWPTNREGHAQYIDIVYWVSLGAHRQAHTEDFAHVLRREQTEAAVRARKCLDRRVSPGRYEIHGTNLVDREGRTLVSRIEPGTRLPDPVVGCVRAALAQVRIPRDPDSFVRPVPVQAAFDVAPGGAVHVQDEEWLALVLAEERAKRMAKRAELEGVGAGRSAPAAPTPGAGSVSGSGAPQDTSAATDVGAATDASTGLAAAPDGEAPPDSGSGHAPRAEPSPEGALPSAGRRPVARPPERTAPTGGTKLDLRGHRRK